ncbi:MAG: response regulator, partial [Terasakiella sp.]|nr:response regulator [Terasakiella sp.]
TEPAGLRIAVMPPWYATGWAQTLWTVLTLALMAVAYGMWRRMARSREDAHIAELNTRTEREINETKLDFYAKITHELRTPCFLISAQIEEILDSEREYVTVQDLSGVYRNSIKLNKLINRIIDFRKIDSGHFRLKPREIELCGYFRDLVPDYEHLCRHKSINFDYVHDAAPIDAVFDPDKLELVVTNLISNAYKYTPDGGDVTLAIRDRGDEVAISVSDTGIGISDAQREAIFQPFYRTERGRQQSGGDGIGLAFVKELVDMHGGRIELATRINEGSVFTVHLPKNLTPAAEPAAATGRKVSAPADEPVDMGIDNPTATRSMLVVDDNPEVIALLTRTFRDDYRVVSAADGAEAIDALERGDFDVVVTDIMMPGLDGHGLIARIKESPRLRSIRIVVFSAVNSEDDIIKAYDAKVDAFITKPASLKVLRRSVDRLFQQEETPVALAPEAAPAAPQSKYNREERRFLLECRRIIDETMTDEDFGIEMLASRLAMSHSSLYKKIRRLTGMSLIEFINEYRIFKAVELFRQGNVNVQTVAAQCGFRDIKTFRETFKRKMNMPPKQFITSLRR